MNNSVVKSGRSRSKPPLIVSGKIDMRKTKLEPMVENKRPNLYSNVPSRVYEIRKRDSEPLSEIVINKKPSTRAFDSKQKELPQININIKIEENKSNRNSNK
jgi:hypothetical protein